jgi:hypothetical protein
MKFLPGILALIVAAELTSVRACDLCGCYTPQLNATPQMSYTLLPWARGWYGAVGEQFTRFGTLQLDGEEVANPTGQFMNSSITQLVAGYQINSRFALQINVPLIYREFKRPEGFEIQRGTVSGLGDVSLLLKTVLFHYASPAQRSFEFQDKKTPIAVEHEPDFTVSAILLTGVKFPTGDSSKLKEEFHEIEILALRRVVFMATISRSAQARMTAFSVSKRRYGTKNSFSRQTCNSRCAVMARTNTTSPTISFGAADRVTTSFGTGTRLSGYSVSHLANTRMWIDSAENQQRIQASLPFFSVRVWLHRAAAGARKSRSIFRFRSTTPRYRLCLTIGCTVEFPCSSRRQNTLEMSF